MNPQTWRDDYRSDDNIQQPSRRNTMIRKSMLALAAIATLGAAALAPTSASAWGFKHHHFGFGHGFGWGHGYYGASYVIAPSCYLERRITRHGYVRIVRVCG
jgi:hypothetical protein